MLCPQGPQDFRGTAETIPILILFNICHHALGQVLYNARFTKDIWTAGTAIYLTALTTPTTVEFRAIFALAKFTAIVEIVTFHTMCDAEYGMHFNTSLLYWSCANVCLTYCTMDFTFTNYIDCWIGFQIETTFFFSNAGMEFEFHSCKWRKIRRRYLKNTT